MLSLYSHHVPNHAGTLKSAGRHIGLAHTPATMGAPLLSIRIYTFRNMARITVDSIGAKAKKDHTTDQNYTVRQVGHFLRPLLSVDRSQSREWLVYRAKKARVGFFATCIAMELFVLTPAQVETRYWWGNYLELV